MAPNFNNEINEFNQGLFDYVPLEGGIFQDDFDDEYILGNNEENNELIIVKEIIVVKIKQKIKQDLLLFV